MEIYQPSEDSYFFVDFLKKYLSSLPSASSMKMLDMGTGSGILAKTASNFLEPKNTLAVDINPNAVRQLKKQKFKTVRSDLFSNIKQKFDLITFNAPYLPEDKREPKSSQLATTGGKRGDEISLKFLRQAKKHLNKNGKIFLLISSLTPIDKITEHHPKIVAKKKVPFEELMILQFS